MVTTGPALVNAPVLRPLRRLAFETQKTATNVEVPCLLAERRGRDSNPRYAFAHTRFPVAFLKPLGHLSGERVVRYDNRMGGGGGCKGSR